MPTDIYEKVFIAWGGNQPLARQVGAQLQSSTGYAPVVGGGKQVDLFVGTQIFSQINGCTRAIILVQDTTGNKSAGGGINLNDNMMFEWGYLMGRLVPSKIHVFLIDLTVRDLPSDLAGSWASEISTSGKTEAEIATEIADKFAQDASHFTETDGMGIMHRWETTKHYLENYDQSPQCSDIELVQYLIHSMETSYYYMEEELFGSLVGKIHPVSSLLDYAAHFVEGRIRLFTETDDLMKPLPFDSFIELKALFDRRLDISYQDERLNLWFEYFRLRSQALLARLIAFSEEFGDDEHQAFLKKSLTLLEDTEAVLTTIISHYPDESPYANLYFGFVNQDRSTISAYLGDRDQAATFNAAAVKAKETFYLDYKRLYPYDTYLTRQFAQEYYLSLAEQLDYTTDPTEQMMIKRSINSFLQKADQDSTRQHVVLKQLHMKFDNGKK